VSTRFQRVEELFVAAATLRPDDRKRFLDESCADDPSLRTDVEALLAAEETTGGFLEPPDRADVDAAVEPPTSADEGRRVGPWRLERLLGEGGMGRVWLATRAEGGFEQRVALKLLRPGFDTGEILARFANERQTLARLEHPHIARLLDGGTTDDELPWFALEHVAGEPIDAYCDSNRLPIEDRVELVLKVLGAASFAHANLVVHRDLKPANVLVDDGGSPKLLDFGIAKFLDPDDDALRTLLTRTGAGPMTPAYASPEQLRGGAITTATDIYAIGVLLYRLLAGRLPYDFAGMTPGELERTVCETDPMKPSAAVTQTDTAGMAAPPEVLRRRLSGDLDNIVLKAMHKDPARRYRSADALADDLKRMLSGLPVEARGDDLGYRASKFLRRHRIAVAFGTIVLGGLITLASVWVGGAILARKLATEIMRLSDEHLLADLKQAYSTLSPARPAHLEAFDDWIDRAEILIGRIPIHELTLADLRRRGTARSSPLDAQIEDFRTQGEARRAGLGGLDATRRAQTEAALARLDERLAGMRRVAERTRPYDFADGEEQWWHDRLSGLLEGLDQLAATDEHDVTLHAAKADREFAATAHRRTVLDHAPAWDAAASRVRAAPGYGGLTLSPQVGLIPIGPDPDSGLEEFAHVQSGAPPVRDPEGRLAFDVDCGLVFVLLPGGAFSMGAPDEDDAALPHERPQRMVELAPFLLSKYEMTQSQWLRVTGREPSEYRGAAFDATPLHPVERVSWTRCREVLFRLGLLLPTEARWEYAARAGRETAWPTGPTPAGLDAVANLADLHARDHGGAGSWSYADAERYALNDGYVRHAPVDRFEPNAFGIHQMIGNVWELCLDAYGAYPEDPRPLTGESRFPGVATRTSRGGGYFNPPTLARVSHRYPLDPDYFSHSLGVRPARNLDS